MKRDLIKKNEGRLTVLQIIGFTILVIGIVGMIAASFVEKLDGAAPAIVSTSFFITMLGFSFAFPSLLESNKGLSTMRIIVFMMTNVICMLLLKIGWASTTGSLEDIGMDWYWMGVIAFVFGAKAIQAFFESKFASPVKEEKPNVGMRAVQFTNADIARLAKEQNEQFLYAKFPNILEVSDAVHDLTSTESHVISIYLKDDVTAGIPDKLEAQMPDHTVRVIGTEIIKDNGHGSINSAAPEIRNGSSFGSVCCMVRTDKGEKKVATAGHVFSMGNATNFGGVLEPKDQSSVKLETHDGQWYFQVINSKTDFALAGFEGLPDTISIRSFSDHYKVGDADVKQTEVALFSTVSGSRKGFILDYNTAWDIDYGDKEVTKNNIILIGSTKDRNTSRTLSERGDSGGCVYEATSGKLVGLILGGNKAFTWVLPIDELLERFNYKII